MSRHDPKVTLRQIAENALRAQELCLTGTLAELVADWRRTLALERVLEIVGEAVKRLPEDLREKYPQVDWKAIAGMRDHLTHGYDGIDYEVLWNAVHLRVPGLLATVDQMLGDLETSGSA